MNEQMKLKIEREFTPQCISDVTKDTGEVVRFFDKYKFAEMIITECAEIAGSCYIYHEPLSSVPAHILKFERLNDENMSHKL
jgi:hypothetical protein